MSLILCALLFGAAATAPAPASAAAKINSAILRARNEVDSTRRSLIETTTQVFKELIKNHSTLSIKELDDVAATFKKFLDACKTLSPEEPLGTNELFFGINCLTKFGPETLDGSRFDTFKDLHYWKMYREFSAKEYPTASSQPFAVGAESSSQPTAAAAESSSQPTAAAAASSTNETSTVS